MPSILIEDELYNLDNFEMIKKVDKGESWPKRYWIAFYKLHPDSMELTEVNRLEFKSKTTRTRWFNKIVKKQLGIHSL